MGVSCQILIKKKKDGVHIAGQTVAGIVRYAIDTPTEYKAVTLSLLGTGNCSWTESRGNGIFETYTGLEVYIIIRKDLLNKKSEATTIDTGSYDYPFTFKLPEDLPSSFKNDTISYRIQVKFEKPNLFSINKTFSTEIPVYGLMDPIVEGPVAFGLEKTLLKLFSSDIPVINLKAEMAKTMLTPGEIAHISIKVINNTDVEPTVWTELFCYMNYVANCGRTTTSHVKIEECSSKKTEVAKRSVSNFTQTIPTRIDLYSITSKVMQKQYKLRVIVRLPLPHVNAMVEIPVVIGQRKGVNVVRGSVEVLEEATGGSTLELGKEVTEDEPPSYWQMMYEEKEKE